MPTAIIDLDHTLLDTTRFKAALASALNLSIAEWDAAYTAFLNDYGMFQPKQFLLGASADEKKSFNEVVSKIRSFLYKDSPEFLHTLHKSGWNIVILTFGEVAWQQEKVSQLTFPEYITVVCTDQPKEAVIGEYIAVEDKTVFINDRADEIDAIKCKYPEVDMYWVNRPNGKHIDAPTEDAILKTDLRFKL